MVNSAPFSEAVTVPAVVFQPGKLVPLIVVKSVEKLVVFKPASAGQPAGHGQPLVLILVVAYELCPCTHMKRRKLEKIKIYLLVSIGLQDE